MPGIPDCGGGGVCTWCLPAGTRQGKCQDGTGGGEGRAERDKRKRENVARACASKAEVEHEYGTHQPISGGYPSRPLPLSPVLLNYQTSLLHIK